LEGSVIRPESSAFWASKVVARKHAKIAKLSRILVPEL
jgi:hypothetical protein